MKKCVRRGESNPGPLDNKDLTYSYQKEPDALTVTPQRFSLYATKYAYLQYFSVKYEKNLKQKAVKPHFRSLPVIKINFFWTI